MNLAEYTQLDTQPKGNGGEYIKFEKTGETRYLRFMYESGGDRMGEDITFRKKFWNPETKKFEYDGEEGTLTCSLECIEYDEDGSNPRYVKWDRSAYFCKNVLLPMWKNYARIIDGVWKVTATNPTTKDATYALFPLMNADSVKYPLEAPKAQREEKVEEKKEEAQPAQKKKYWE